jgi:hypothetical protein
MPDLLVVTVWGKESDQVIEPIALICHEKSRRKPMFQGIGAASLAA